MVYFFCSHAGRAPGDHFAKERCVPPMKGNILRWCLAVLMLLAMALFLSSPAVAEVTPLGMDLKVHGVPPRESGWLSDTEYQDESIHIVMDSEKRKPPSSESQVMCRWVVIDIADPSQLRTTMSNESYDDVTLERPWEMAQRVNAVVACNSDFIKFSYNVGFVVRQGVFYRDALDGNRDVLIIDNNGDFEAVQKATSEDMAAKRQEIENDGRQIVNAFCFGPVLVRNGEAQELALNKFEKDQVEGHLPTQRIAICQLDTLKYAIVEVDGGVVDGSGMNGMNLKELTKFILLLFPDCKLAYNLDGGGSAHLMLRGKPVHRTPGSRHISDLIYFASAASEE